MDAGKLMVTTVVPVAGALPMFSQLTPKRPPSWGLPAETEPSPEIEVTRSGPSGAFALASAGATSVVMSSVANRGTKIRLSIDRFSHFRVELDYASLPTFAEGCDSLCTYADMDNRPIGRLSFSYLNDRAPRDSPRAVACDPCGSWSRAHAGSS